MLPKSQHRRFISQHCVPSSYIAQSHFVMSHPDEITEQNRFSIGQLSDAKYAASPEPLKARDCVDASSRTSWSEHDGSHDQWQATNQRNYNDICAGSRVVPRWEHSGSFLSGPYAFNFPEVPGGGPILPNEAIFQGNGLSQAEEFPEAHASYV